MKLGPKLRVWSWIAATVALCAAGPLITHSKSAHACVPATVDARSLPDLLGSSTVVAVGQLTHATKSRISLHVEEGLKATTAGQTLTLSNQRIGMGTDCSVHIAPADPGFALPEGKRVIAFLTPDVSGEPNVWGPAWAGAYVFEVEEDDRPFGLISKRQVMSLIEIRDELAASQDVPFEPGLDKVLPCNVVWFWREALPGYARMSAAIAVGTVVDVKGGILTVASEEILRGEVSSTFTVNGNAQFRIDAHSCALVQARSDYSGELGERMIFFLHPDEFGVAQWRIGVWGVGMLDLRGDWVTLGLPSISDVRALLASGVGTAPPIAPPREVPGFSNTPASQDGNGRPWLAVGVLAAIGLTGAVFVVALRARQR